MASIERFEDVEAWKEAREFVREIYLVTRQGEFARDFGLRDQLRRAAVSVMSSIAEGFERGSDKEFRRFLYIAKASAGETRSLLTVATDVGYVDEKSHSELRTKVVGISKRVGGFISYLDGQIGSK